MILSHKLLFDRIYNYRIVYYFRKWNKTPLTFNEHNDYVYNEI